MRSPIVIVPASTREIGSHLYLVTQMKYANAVLHGCACLPLILPAFGDETDIDAVLAVADGIMLTGSVANIHPSHYAQELHDPALPQDLPRDATTLPLIRAALKRDIPLFSICRGFQEVNVALGGSLHQAVQEVPGMLDHREDSALDTELQYAPVHNITLERNGQLSHILGGAGEIMVNSLHGQGIERLAQGLQVEAWADDGLIEAYSIQGSNAFSLAVQWHPEWRLRENPDSMKLFRAFGDACRDYQLKRVGNE